MKVCILTSVHHPFDDRIFYKQARSLVRAGYDVTLVSPHEQDEEVDGVRILSVPKNLTRWGRMLATSGRVLLQGLKVKATIYHFHDPELIPVGLLLRLLGKKVIYDIHEYNAETVLTKHWLPTGARGAVSRAVMWLDRYAVRKMSSVVVVNEHMAELFRAGLSLPRPIVAVHNYPELPEVAGDAGHSCDEPVAIYVGSLSKDRGLEILLEMGERLKRAHAQARVQVLGPLDLAGVRAEYAFVDRWGAYGVEHLGTVAHRDVAKRLRHARVGLIPWLPTPNHLKGIPVKLFEYMLAELPVVASDFGFISQIVRDTGCGLLVPPGDAAALSKAIEVLLRDPSRAAEMGQRGRMAVLDRYNWGSEEKKLLALYESLGRDA